MVDIAHIAGLVAAGLHPSPVPHCEFVTTTTHKTLRGPRGGMILCREAWAKEIDRAVFPGVQGGPLMHVIAGQGRRLRGGADARVQGLPAADRRQRGGARAGACRREGLRLVTGGTDNHLMLRRRVRHGHHRQGGREGARQGRDHREQEHDPVRHELADGRLRHPPRHARAHHARDEGSARWQQVAKLVSRALRAIENETELRRREARRCASCATASRSTPARLAVVREGARGEVVKRQCSCGSASRAKTAATTRSQRVAWNAKASRRTSPARSNSSLRSSTPRPVQPRLHHVLADARGTRRPRPSTVPRPRAARTPRASRAAARRALLRAPGAAPRRAPPARGSAAASAACAASPSRLRHVDLPSCGRRRTRAERLVDRDPREPRREARALRELVEVQVGVHVRLLHHVLGLRLVPHDRARHPVQPLVVAAHQDLEQRGLAQRAPVARPPRRPASPAAGWASVPASPIEPRSPCLPPNQGREPPIGTESGRRKR